jgi:uncharacterized protein (UPF0335 family)
MARRFKKPKKIIEAHAFKTDDLKSFAKRLGNIDADIAALKADRKEVLIEADAKGFHKKVLTRVLADLRREEKMSIGERECFDNYRDALTGTPLALAAAKREEKPKPRSNSKPFQNGEAIAA